MWKRVNHAASQSWGYTSSACRGAPCGFLLYGPLEVTRKIRGTTVFQDAEIMREKKIRRECFLNSSCRLFPGVKVRYLIQS